MKNKTDTVQVIQRLNGFQLYGSKLSVKMARTNFEWKNGSSCSHHVFSAVQSERGINYGNLGDAEDIRFRRNQYVEIKDENKFQNKKRVTGHVENEELWELRRCLMGKTESVCSVSNIHNRELGFTGGTFYPLRSEGDIVKVKGEKVEESESTSNSKSEGKKSPAAESSSESEIVMADELGFDGLFKMDYFKVWW
ncbi:hypothetical protein V6N13_147911 [Hibiscus sabdariffa]